MVLDLDPILAEPIRVGAKGIPLSLYGRPLSDLGAAGLSLFDPEMSFPLAAIERGALDHNLGAMQAYLADARMLIAPHGKTTMCPQLFDLQLRSGAWGITLANWPQARVALAHGVRRVLIANQLVSPAEIRDLAQVLNGNPDLEIVSLVDSSAQLARIETAVPDHSGRKIPVMVELGFHGGRCGVREDADALALAEAVAASGQVCLAGIEGYEGLLVSDDPDADAVAVSQFVGRLVRLFSACEQRGLFDYASPPILSAGGSAYFDLVARGFAADMDRCRPVLRSGCYLTHDVGFYEKLLQQAKARAVLGEPPRLRPALFVWTQVLSCPEPGLALIGLGRRDVSDDSAMPLVVGHWRGGAEQPLPEGWSFFRMNDQHGYLRVPDTADVAVGDLVKFGISHPCTTFDRWAWLLEIDSDCRVTGSYRSFF
jgi:D-serine dehydratase